MFGLDPDDKYAAREPSRRARAHQFESLAKVVAAVDPSSLDETLGRLVFSILSGNEDAHLKNWALVYDETSVRARLAPAYDLVCTAAFEPHDPPRTALSNDGERDMRRISSRDFHGLAPVFDEDTYALEQRVARWEERIRDVASEALSTPTLPDAIRTAVRRHLESVRLGRC